MKLVRVGCGMYVHWGDVRGTVCGLGTGQFGAPLTRDLNERRKALRVNCPACKAWMREGKCAA